MDLPFRKKDGILEAGFHSPKPLRILLEVGTFVRGRNGRRRTSSFRRWWRSRDEVWHAWDRRQDWWLRRRNWMCRIGAPCWASAAGSQSLSLSPPCGRFHADIAACSLMGRPVFFAVVCRWNKFGVMTCIIRRADNTRNSFEVIH
jgi:hypothetical protein